MIKDTALSRPLIIPSTIHGAGLFGRLRSLSLLRKVSLSFIALHLLATALFTVSGYRLQMAAQQRVTNTQLADTVHALPAVIGDDYLRELLTNKPIDESRYATMLKRLDDYVQKTGVDSIYVLVRRQGSVRFVIDSASDGKHFALYTSGPAELNEVFQEKNFAYAEYDDEYGRFRSLFVPYSAGVGDEVVLGSDVNLDGLEAERWKSLLEFLGIGLVIFPLGLMIGLPLAQAIFYAR